MIQKINSLIDRKLFIQITKELCHERRLEANSSWKYPEPNFEAYFEQVIWSSFQKYKEELSIVQDIFILDGLLSKEELLSQSMKLIGKIDHE